MMNSPQHKKVEFGDFQTPADFARQICSFLWGRGIRPASILEPTCGVGNLFLAALEQFPNVSVAVGVDINANYIESLQQQIGLRGNSEKATVFEASFFDVDWQQLVDKLPKPILIIGNPPWVTNAQLTSLQSDNLPQKSNFQNHAGIEAITGASNFDISEWMLLKIVEWANGRDAIVAMLCKTAVSRKLLLQTWQHSPIVGNAQLHLIDAKKIFNASVDACLFVYDSRTKTSTKSCDIFTDLAADSFLTKIGYEDGQLIANLDFYQQWKHLGNQTKSHYRWRSGIKHDSAKVMELKRIGQNYANKLGQTVDLEKTYLYPMMKSSDIAAATIMPPRRWMLVTQQSVGENTRPIKIIAPKTWTYLTEHSAWLDSRKSSIYKNRPRFSIFGVGGYSFAPWKVAISGLYKSLNFTAVGPYEGKPVVLDDTCYGLACQSKEEAEFVARLLNSKPAQEFFQAFVFWDAKRPITIKVLQKLDLFAVAEELNCRETLERFVRPLHYDEVQPKQLALLEKPAEYDK